MNWTPIIEAGKEMLRVVVLAVIPVLIASLESGQLNIDWKVVAVVAALAALRFIDKALHKLGKETDNETLITGLTRF